MYMDCYSIECIHVTICEGEYNIKFAVWLDHEYIYMCVCVCVYIYFHDILKVWGFGTAFSGRY